MFKDCLFRMLRRLVLGFLLEFGKEIELGLFIIIIVFIIGVITTFIMDFVVIIHWVVLF